MASRSSVAIVAIGLILATGSGAVSPPPCTRAPNRICQIKIRADLLLFIASGWCSRDVGHDALKHRFPRFDRIYRMLELS